MKRDDSEQRRVQAAVHQLMDTGMSLLEISQLAGVNYEHLRNFSSKKMSINPAEFADLKTWIDSRVATGDLKKSIEKPAESGDLRKLKEAVRLASAELEVLLQALRSDTWPDDSKLRKLFAWCEVNYSDLLRLRQSLKDGKQG